MQATTDITRLYDAHADAIFGFVLSLARHEADARDGLQAVFVKLAQVPARLTDVKDERAYLLQIAHRTFIDLVRRRAARARAHAEFAAETADAFFEPTGDEKFQGRSAELAAALALLPTTQLAVIHLKIWEELTFDEIGALLQVPKGTVVSRYRAALDHLQTALDVASRAHARVLSAKNGSSQPVIPPSASLLA